MPASFNLRSDAFDHEGAIPSRYTCDGANLSPPLAWSNPPNGTHAFALLVDDPDAPDPAAPQRVWVHWIRYNMPAKLTSLKEAAGNDPPEAPIRDAVTDSNRAGYHGPCPPIGRHRYFFHLFALSTSLPDLGPKARRRDLEAAMSGRVLGTAELMGTYARDRSRRS